MPKQSELKGMERPKIEALDEAIEEYEDWKGKRLKALDQEVALKQKITDLLHQHRLKSYKTGDDGEAYIARLEPGEESLSVRPYDAEKEAKRKKKKKKEQPEQEQEEEQPA